MASFSSRPNEFTPYVPEINPELYGQMLGNKEQKYQQGIQRIENTRASVASLPIANYADRQYAQQKMDAITSELNRTIGADWSDAGITNLTSKHISAIASDPTIQNAVQSTMGYKQDYQDFQDMKDTYGAAAIGNTEHASEGFANYLNAPTGTKYNSSLVPFTDIDKGATEHLSKVKPDLLKLVKTAADANGVDMLKGWELATRQYEGVDRQKLQTALDEYINTTPGVREQMYVNALHTYKGYGVEQYVQRAGEVNLNRAAFLTKTLADMANQKLTNNDPAIVANIDAGMDSVKQQLIGLSNHDYNKDRAEFHNNRESAISNIYEQNWKLGMLTDFSGGNKYEESFGGMSPREMHFKQVDDNRAERQFQDKMAQERIGNRQWEADYALKVKEFETKHPPVISSTAPSSSVTGGTKDAVQLITEKAASMTNSSTQSMVDYLAGLGASKGLVDNIGTSDLFTVSPEGQNIVRDGYKGLTDKGTLGILSPTVGVIQGMEYGKDYVSNSDYLLGFTDKQGVKHPGMADKLLDDYSKGGKNLSLTQKNQLAALKEQRDDAEAQSVVPITLNKIVDQRMPTDTEALTAKEKVQNYLKPFTIHSGSTAGTYSEPLVKDFYNYYNAYRKAASAPLDQADKMQVDADNLLKVMQAKYPGLDNSRVQTLFSHFEGVDQAATTYSDRRATIANQVAKQYGVSPVTNALVLTDGTEETAKVAAGKVSDVLAYLDRGAKSYGDQRAIIAQGYTKDNGFTIKTGYDETHPSQPYFYEVGNSKKGTPDRIYMTEKEARTLNVPVEQITPVESKLDRTLKINAVGYQNGFTSTVPVGKANSWENAKNLLITPNEQFRYVVEKSKSGDVVLYKYRMKDGKIDTVEEPFSTVEAAYKKIQDFKPEQYK